MEGLSFPLLLLDECSQMTEPASLLPMARYRQSQGCGKEREEGRGGGGEGGKEGGREGVGKRGREGGSEC